MKPMTLTEAQNHIKECRRMLTSADRGTSNINYVIGSLILAIGQLAEVVEDLANREQGKVIQ